MVKDSDGQLQECSWEDALIATGRKVHFMFSISCRLKLAPKGVQIRNVHVHCTLNINHYLSSNTAYEQNISAQKPSSVAHTQLAPK